MKKAEQSAQHQHKHILAPTITGVRRHCPHGEPADAVEPARSERQSCNDECTRRRRAAISSPSALDGSDQVVCVVDMSSTLSKSAGYAVRRRRA